MMDGIQYTVSDYGTHRRAQQQLGAIDAVAELNGLRYVIGHRSAWIVNRSGRNQSTMSRPMQRAVRQAGGRVTVF